MRIRERNNRPGRPRALIYTLSGELGLGTWRPEWRWDALEFALGVFVSIDDYILVHGA